MSTSNFSPKPNQTLFVIADYRENLAHVHAHLSGDDGNSLEPSCIAPAGYWTAAEKNAFFHAVCIYSRLRPDLIADHIKTKTVVDVCAYLDGLEGAAAQHDRQTIRRTLPCAMEVSDAWVEEEQKAARELIAREPEWEEEALQRARDVEMKRKKALGTAHQGIQRQHAEFDEWKERREDEYHREDILRRLESAHLRTIESILREDEERPSGPALTPSAGQRIHPEQAPSPSAPTSIAGSPAPDDDPLSEGNADRSSVAPDGLSPASRRRFQKRLYMRRKRAAATGAQVVANAVRLRPGRKKKEKAPRPRPSKYLRQGKVKDGGKESEDGDIEIANDTQASDDHAMDGEQGGTETGRGQETDDGSANGGLHPNNAHSLHHPHDSGQTAPYRIKNKFVGAGIDASWLHENGCGLINSRNLSKHMKTYATLHKAAPTVLSGISADTIQFLNAHLVDFVTDLCHRVVVSREQEAQFKARTRAWRFQPSPIPPSNVEYALEMMGFGALVERITQKQAVNDQGNTRHKRIGKTRQESDTDNDSDTGLADADESPPCTTHQEMHPAFVRLPPHSYPPRSRTRSQSPSSVADDSDADHLLPLEADEDALAAELMEEEELNGLDVEDEAAHEQALWQNQSDT